MFMAHQYIALLWKKITWATGGDPLERVWMVLKEVCVLMVHNPSHHHHHQSWKWKWSGEEILGWPPIIMAMEKVFLHLQIHQNLWLG
jgi:hypothetical protein